jgi:hypothetical protein
MVWLEERQATRPNPLDLVEELIGANDWRFERPSDCELMAEIDGQWCGYYLYFVWREEMNAITFSCHFDQKVPFHRRTPIYELLARVNERLWLGHFELASEDGAALFRHTLSLRGFAGVSAEVLEDLVDVAVEECERFYPALQMVLWGGRPVGEAVEAALMETQGEA